MSDFKNGLTFKVEWESPGGARSPELAATWCRLEVWIDDLCLTLVEEAANASTRRSIYVPLYPLAEWAAYNWWFLQSHSRPAAVPANRWTFDALTRQHDSKFSWLRNHNLRNAGDGYPWPDLTIVPEGPYTRIIWTATPPASVRGGLRYLSSGEALVPSEQVRVGLTGLIETTLSRLAESGVRKSPLNDEWAAQTNLDAEEQDFCSAAARLGLDGLDIEDDVVRDLDSVGAALSGELLTDFLDAVSPDELVSSLAWVSDALADIQGLGHGQVASDLVPLREALQGASRATESRNPWDIGYAEARAVREVLGLSATDHLNIEALLRTEVRPHSTRSLDGVGDAKGLPTILLARTGRQEGQRFSTARGLWHVLAEDLEKPFVLTHSRGYKQKIERAFAAELLAPAQGISQLLEERSPADTDALDAIAMTFGVQSRLVDYQIFNDELG